MANKRGIFVGMSKEFIVKTLLKGLTLNAFAEESPESVEGEDNKPAPTVNYEDLIAKARKEEKDKQYKTIEKLKSQISALTEQHNTDLLAKADLEKKLKEAQDKLKTSGAGDSEEVKTLKSTIAQLEKDKETLEKKVKEFEDNKPASREDIEKEIREQLDKEYTVKAHKTQILAEHKDDLLLPELVFGDTVEELDKNLEAALTRSKEIREKLGVSEGVKPKNKRTPKNPTNPTMSGAQDNEYDINYIASLDPASEEYKEFRRKQGLR